MLSFESRADRLAWNRMQRPVQRVAHPGFVADVARWAASESAPRLAVGMRRSYSDVCLSGDANVVEMAGCDRLIAFDQATGILTAEAGITLAEIARFAVPRGFFLPTSPGTRYVTLGGAIANDVHGKNHHRAGTFGTHVGAIALSRSDMGAVTVSPDNRPDLHAATIGGLGLTGVITSAELRLAPIRSSTLDTETLAFSGIDEFLALAAESEADHEFTVAWLDGTFSRGAPFRGLFHRANWSAEGGLVPHREGALAVPFDAPSFAINPLTLGALNRLYRGANRWKGAHGRQHYAPFFYPLDSIGGWNRLYGPKGFYQYQFVVPFESAKEALAEAWAVLASSGQGSFLTVLKTFGTLPSPGLMSFPRPGVTLALDLANRGEPTLRLMGALDAVIAAAGGRLYPAKDSRIPPAMLRAGYPAWENLLSHADPAMRSDFLERMRS